MPEFVQVGNEINTEVLMPGPYDESHQINWPRNARLINAGIRGALAVGGQAATQPQVVLHIAQPEEVEGWLLAAERAGVTDYDIVGLSYYPGWSDHTIETTGSVIRQLRHRFNTEVMIVETGYPWTFDAVSESASNIPDRSFLLEGYPATLEGQRQFLIDLAQSVFDNGGLGIVYWEPAWVSTLCFTQWGQGSHWENATFFDFQHDNAVLPAIEFLQHAYTYPEEVNLTFRSAENDPPPEMLFFWGDFTGIGRRPLRLSQDDIGTYTLHTRLLPGATIRYQFYSDTPASAETALLAGDCLNGEGYAVVTIPDGT